MTWPPRRLLFAVVAFCPALALAQKPTPPGRASAAAPASAASRDPLPFVAGPRTIDLGHELTLDLPAEHAFLPPEPAVGWTQWLCQVCMGNHNENLLGIVQADGHRLDWFVDIRYDEEGHIKDDDADIDADALLESAASGRGSRVLGWAEPPRYDPTLHQLVWSLRVQGHQGEGVDFYYARALGRRGTVTLALGGFLGPGSRSDATASAAALLRGIRFKPGSRYEDFDANTDKVADHGLVALIPGGAALAAHKAAQVGVLTKLGNAIVAKKPYVAVLVVAGLIGAGALLTKLFRRRDT